MHILALETTEAVGSVAAASGATLLRQLDFDPQMRSAQSFAPAIKQILAEVGWRPTDVKLVAVSIGPGSFTGLRIGVTAAKTFAYAVGAEVLGVGTLWAVAAAAPRWAGNLSVAVDAQRGDVVAADFSCTPDGWPELTRPERLLPASQWLAGLPPGTAIAGPALRKLQDQIPAGLTVLEPQHWRPTAAAVARLAFRDYSLGRRDDLWALKPYYCRLAAAEEKLLGRAAQHQRGQ